MNRTDLAHAVRARHGTTLTPDQAVRAVLDEIARAVIDGDRVTVTGFGSWSAVTREPRTGRNPRTGAPVAIGPRRAPVFRPADAFAAAVANPQSAPDRPITSRR